MNAHKKIQNQSFYHQQYLIIAFLSLIFMMLNSTKGSMWYDEMYTVGLALGNSVPNSMYITFALMRTYIKSIPIEQIYIYILPEVGVALSVYIIGLIGEKLKGGRTGLYACTIMAFSPYIIQQVGVEFRSYFMLLLLSCFVFYLFLQRYTYNNHNWMVILYGLASMLLMDCHEYGKVLAILFLCCDLILIFLKKISNKNIISSIFVLLYGLFWLYRNELGGLWNNYSWTSVPTPEIVYQTIRLLLSNSAIFFILFIIGTLSTLRIAIKMLEKYRFPKSFFDFLVGFFSQGECIALLLIIGIFSASIIYSTVINPENSLYVNRYFISVIAYMILFAAIGLDRIFSMDIIRNFCKKSFVQSLIIIALLSINMYQYACMPEEHNHPYRQTAECMRYIEEAYYSDSMVFIPDNGYVSRAWIEYLNTNKKINVYNKYNFDISNAQYKRIYVVAPAYRPTNEQQQFLDSYYNLNNKIENLPIWVYELKS